MRLNFCVLLTLLSLASGDAAHAALALRYQRLAELRAILDTREVTDPFPDAQPIARVEYLRDDVYRVSSAACRMDVSIVEKPMPAMMVGPRQFAAKAGKLSCVTKR